MDFKRYLLTENPHATLNMPIRSGGSQISIVDLRIEDWEVDASQPNAQETEDFRRKLAMFQFNGYPPFYGQIPSDGRYLYHDGKDSFNFAIVPSPPNSDIANLDTMAIKKPWWFYVQGMDNEGNVIKQAGRARSGEVATVHSN